MILPFCGLKFYLDSFTGVSERGELNPSGCIRGVCGYDSLGRRKQRRSDESCLKHNVDSYEKNTNYRMNGFSSILYN